MQTPVIRLCGVIARSPDLTDLHFNLNLAANYTKFKTIHASSWAQYHISNKEFMWCACSLGSFGATGCIYLFIHVTGVYWIPTMCQDLSENEK